MSSQNESMYTQYLAWYQGHRAKYGPQTAVLMQVGKFFEIYDRLNLFTNSTNTNIREIADLCSLNLSESKESDSVVKLFGGFPEQSLPKFERQLLDAGYTVVIVIQKKNIKGDVEERTVERISSPGIYENRYTTLSRSDTKDSFLLGLLLEPCGSNLVAGLTAVDIQTGMTWSTETVLSIVQGTPNIDDIEPFFLMHPPAEVVCWHATATEQEIRAWFRLDGATLVHMRREPVDRPPAEFVRSAFSMKTNLQPHVALGLERHPSAYKTVGATLKFIEDHIPSLLKKLRNNSVWIPEERVRLGNAALEQLNIIKNSNECLLFWLQKTFSVLGRRQLRERILTPISDVSVLEARFKRIAALGDVTNSEIEKNLRSVYDLSRLHRKLNLHVLSLIDVSHLLLTYRSIQALIQKFGGSANSMPNGKTVETWLDRLQAPWSLERISSAELELERTHPWTPGVYSDLDRYEADWKALIAEATEFAAKNSDPGAPINLVRGEHVQFEFVITRKRYEKMSNSSNFQYHSNSAKSSSGTLDSSEIRTLQHRAASLQRSWTQRQDEIWLQIQEEWSIACEELVGGKFISDYISEWVANLDVEFALARISKEFGFAIPQFINSSDSSVEIQGLRHPIIERIHTQSPYVRHNITLGLAGDEVSTANSGLLIYGTNASGKSSLMKALGIAVLCAQTGIPVAANSMKISPYKSIFTRILGNDNMWAALSSFAVEMTEFRSILKYANKNSLILGDELCSGTETQSATAIVSAGIQILAKRGAQFLFATHLHEISELEEVRRLNGVKFAHLGIEYNSATKQIVYKRTLEAGPGSSLYGLEVCQGLDMDAEFLALAANSRKFLTSRYNSQVLVRNCAICKSTTDLETHHIQHQATAVNGFVDAATQIHRASNLTVLCGNCHTRHHSGQIQIQGWRDTSTGRELVWQHVTPTVPVPRNEIEFDRFIEVRDRLRILLSKKTKEREIIYLLSAEYGTVTVTEVRNWKKRLI
jgi:DNA mismatch repair protein MutS